MTPSKATLGAALVGVLLTSCIPAETDDDIVRAFNVETEMGQIQEAGELVVGVPEETFPLDTGFFTDLATEIADSLGVEARIDLRPAEELQAMVEPSEEGVEPPADVVFPLIPLTVSNVLERSFTDPYFVAHQRLLVPEGSTVTEVEDLAGATVCEAVDPVTGVGVEDIEPTISISAATPDECLRALEAGEVDAVTAHDLILVVLAARSGGFEIVGEDLSTVGYGAQVETGATGFAGFIDTVFDEAEDEGRWLEYYDEWIAPYLGDETELPDLSVEDAAALYPEE